MRTVPFVQNRQVGTLDHRDMLCTSIRGTTGRGTGFGRLRFSATSFGDTRRIAGTYQKRAVSKDPTRYDPDTNPRYPNIAMRTYRPTYTNTEIQAENRYKMQQAVLFWQGLTNEEKSMYDERGAKVNLPGYNVAISDFMRYYDESP